MTEVAALPGMVAWEDIAHSAYRAYGASTGGRNCGEPMPTWNELPVPIKTAWEAAVRQAGIILQSSGEYGIGSEGRWENWLPPHRREKP